LDVKDWQEPVVDSTIEHFANLKGGRLVIPQDFSFNAGVAEKPEAPIFRVGAFVAWF